MKRESLFTKIWKKHQKKGENPAKLAEDLGMLKGLFSFKKYDPKTGLILFESQKYNTLTNQSKSTLIRLISQGESPWLGTIDPTELKISRMRFGNHDGATASRLNYYKLDETGGYENGETNKPTATRPNNPLPQSGEVDPDFAGGKSGKQEIPGANTTVDSILDAYDSHWVSGPDDTKVYTIPTLAAGTGYIHPPSHETLVVKFYKDSSLIETLTFGEDGDGVVYTRSRLGIPPTKITTETGEDPIIPPNEGGERDGGGETTIDETNEANCNTRLFYDYTTGSTGWKLKVEEIDYPEGAYDRIDFSYEVGKYNVINSIIPREGYNIGYGITNLTRYQGSLDYYSTIGDPEYRDSADDFIDDYAVTFSVNMTGPYGNGETDVNQDEYIRYTEAFLFNELDDMFSLVILPNPFDKNEGSAYYISWSILAPIN